MLRHGRAVGVILALVLATACSRHDGAQMRAELTGAGHDAAKDFRHAAAEAKVAAHHLAADTRHAAHDVSHPSQD